MKQLFIVMCIIQHIFVFSQIRIGMNHNPPYIDINIKDKDTIYTGITVDFLKRLNSDFDYKFVYAASKENSITLLKNKKVDIVANASLTSDRLREFYSTLPYMHSEVGVCTKKDNSLNGLELIIYNIKQQKWNIVILFLAFYVLFLVFGSIKYIFDNFIPIIIKKNKKFSFDELTHDWYFVFVALFEGFEDKTKTSLSRFMLINLIMFLVLIVLPLITGIAMVEIQKTNQSFVFSSINDLKKYNNIITIKGTSNEKLLKNKNINYTTVASVAEAMTVCQIKNGIFVHDKLILENYIRKQNLENKIQIHPFTLQLNDRVFLYNYSLKNKKFGEQLNYLSLDMKDSGEMDFILSQYLQ